MKRRHFIGMAATGAAGMVWPATAGGGTPRPVADFAHPRLLDILRDQRLVRDLGRRYRETVPAETNARALEQAIRTEVSVSQTEGLGVRVDEHVRRDFAAGRIVTLGGWVLSVTEARQCALYSLLPA